MAPRLTTRYMGLELRSPLVASPSPLTGRLDGLRALEDAGIGAVVLPSLFEEQIVHESMEIHRVLTTGAEGYAESLDFWPEMEHYNTGPDSYLELVSEAKDALDVPVIASLNGMSRGGWIDHARLIESAGADALELNIYFLATDDETTASMIEIQYLDLVEGIAGQIGIPLAVKLSPYFNAPAHMAKLLARAGADGLVLFNRFYQPDLDLEEMAVLPRLVLSTSDELRLPLRWIAILYGRIEASLAATTGIHTATDALKALCAGADVAMMTSALLRRGPAHVRTVEAGMIEWLEEREYSSTDELRGCLSQRAVADPQEFERANYMKALTTYSSDLPL